MSNPAKEKLMMVLYYLIFCSYMFPCPTFFVFINHLFSFSESASSENFVSNAITGENPSFDSNLSLVVSGQCGNSHLSHVKSSQRKANDGIVLFNFLFWYLSMSNFLVYQPSFFFFRICKLWKFRIKCN